MPSNIEKHKDELKKLIAKGEMLEQKLQYECFPQEVKKQLDKKQEVLRFLKIYPPFSQGYQEWYSESLYVIKFLLPDRVVDFIKLYEKPKSRKSISSENYTIEDALTGLRVTGSWDKPIADESSAIPRFRQQVNILKSAERRFEGSFFDIRQMLQADLFDSELDAAEELNNNGYGRAAGAMAGVVLESHLLQVCANHNVKIAKRDPSINDLGDLLKNDDVIEIKDWRFIQHLSDIRNKCDHKKESDPTKEEIDDLINGIDKICKTIF